MALGDKPFDHWTSKMKEWLGPQIFEIGRTEAVHLASPSLERLKNWIGNHYSEYQVPPAKETPCDDGVEKCKNIEPIWPSRDISRLVSEHLSEILLIFALCILLVALANRHVNETVRDAFCTSSPERKKAWVMISPMIAVIFVVAVIFWWVHDRMNDSLAQGTGEPFLWLEGISVWPSLMIRSVGLLTVLGLWWLLGLKMHHQKTLISKDFKIPLATVQTLDRSWWSAVWTGPHLDLASVEKDGTVTTLWHNYLWATSFREMRWWIGASIVITILSVFAMFSLWGRPSFPRRGLLVLELHTYLFTLHTWFSG